MENKISIEYFKKIEIKVGRILSVEKVENTDKLLKLSVDFGLSKIEEINENGEKQIKETKDIRQIISGIALYFENHDVLLNKKYMFLTNLEPRRIRGLESNGMILALSTEKDNSFSLIYPDQNIEEGIILK